MQPEIPVRLAEVNLQSLMAVRRCSQQSAAVLAAMDLVLAVLAVLAAAVLVGTAAVLAAQELLGKETTAVLAAMDLVPTLLAVAVENQLLVSQLHPPKVETAVPVDFGAALIMLAVVAVVCFILARPALVALAVAEMAVLQRSIPAERAEQQTQVAVAVQQTALAQAVLAVKVFV